MSRPGTVDALIRVQQQLDETPVVMHENVNKILARGDSIDLLVEKSSIFSQQSKNVLQGCAQTQPMLSHSVVSSVQELA